MMNLGIIRSFNARCRRRFVRWCLDAIEGGIKRKLDILEAVHFSIDCWRDVEAECIRNCWIKSRIMDATLMAEIRQAGDYTQATDKAVIDDIVSMLIGIEVHENVDDYLDIDCDVEVHEQIDSDSSSSFLDEVGSADEGE